MKLTRTLLVLLVVGCLGTVGLRADDDKKDDEKDAWWKQITWNGLVSVAYSHNFHHPDSQTNQLRVFDFDDRSFKVDVGELVVQRPVAEKGDAGFRLDLEVGSSIPKLEAASGLFRDVDTGEAEDVDVQQALVSYIAPVGRGLRLDFGKHITHAGFEVIEGYDAYNWNYTHSFLFGYAIPFTHTGIKVAYPWSDKFSTMFCVVNGWDNAKDNNDKKTLGFQLYGAPTSVFNFYVNYVNGAERSDDTGDIRQVLDLIANINPTDHLKFGLNYDYGSEEDAVVEGQDAKWWGLAGYARFEMGHGFALNLRGEVFDDKDGYRTGTAQKLKEYTLTPEIKCKDHLVFRADLRLDQSDEDVFEHNATLDDTQTTIALNALYVF